MEQPAVRSRTSSSSTLGCLRYAECFSPPQEYTTLSEALTKKGRLLCSGNACVAWGCVVAFANTLRLLVVVVGIDHRVG